MRRRRLPVRELVLCAGAVALCLALGEVWVRGRGLDLNPSQKFLFHPVYGWTMEPGLRRPAAPGPPGVPEPSGREPFRLLLVGDSFTYAIEQPVGRGFPGLLARDLAPRGVEVRTLASGGWGTAQELLALRREGLPWHPDAVVLQVFPYNDLCNNSLGLADTCSRLDEHRPYFVLDGDGRLRLTWLHPFRARARRTLRLFGLAENLELWRGLVVEGETEAEFGRRSEDWATANARARGLELSGNLYALMPEAGQPEPVRAGWRVTEALLAAFDDELSARGIRLAVVVIPFVRTVTEGWEYFRRYHRAPLEAGYDTGRVESFLAGRGVPTLSMRERLLAGETPPAQSFNRRNLHLSQLGHRQVAEWIERLLVEEGWLPAGAPIPAV